MNDNGNKYFRKRRLYKNTFVEDYLSRNNRALNNFMTRLFILAPNLKDKLYNSDNRLRFINIPAEFFKRPKGQFYGDKK